MSVEYDRQGMNAIVLSTVVGTLLTAATIIFFDGAAKVASWWVEEAKTGRGAQADYRDDLLDKQKAVVNGYDVTRAFDAKAKKEVVRTDKDGNRLYRIPVEIAEEKVLNRLK